MATYSEPLSVTLQLHDGFDDWEIHSCKVDDTDPVAKDVIEDLGAEYFVDFLTDAEKKTAEDGTPVTMKGRLAYTTVSGLEGTDHDVDFERDDED